MYQNLWGAEIGEGTRVASYVEIGKGVVIGDNCNIQSFVYIPPHVRIGNSVFIGPGVIFTNDKHAPSHGEWKKGPWTTVESFVSIGAGAVILPGIRIGRGARIGAGAVVTKDVPAGVTVVGNPAEPIRYHEDRKEEVYA